MRGQNIILIGFMGAGKTSVGEALAEAADKPLLDTDRMIEERAGMTISRIFEEKGEAAFRQLETEVLETLLETAEGEVISVGGGLPMRENNREMLRKLGTVIYLKTEPETVLMRLKGDTTRPLLQAEDVKERVTSLLAVRGPVYTEAAHLVLAVDDLTVDEAALAIMEQTGWRKKGEHGDEVTGTKRAEYQLPGDPGKGDLWNGGLWLSDPDAGGKGGGGRS